MKVQELIRWINSPENGPAIRRVCSRFVALCRQIGLLVTASVAIDGLKFKAVNSEAPNGTGPSERAERPDFTAAKMRRRMAQIEKSVARYLDQLDTADR